MPDPQDPGRVQVWLLQGRKPLSFQKSQIAEVIPRPSALDDYFQKVKAVGSSAQAQYDFGIWCEQNKLMDMAKSHFELALLADKTFEPAHKKLHHKFYNGYWLSQDDLSAMQGLVKHKGRWISVEEKTKRQAQEDANALQATWVRRIKILRQSLINGPMDRRREAESQLMAIRDVAAVTPLLRVLGTGDASERILCAQVLAAIPGKEATAGLVKEILAESDPAVRSIILDKLRDRDDPGTITQLLSKGLLASDIQVINRAAWARESRSRGNGAQVDRRTRQP